MLKFISMPVFAVIAMIAAAPAQAGQQTLGCVGEWTGKPTIKNPQALRFIVTVTNPLKMLVPATPPRKPAFVLSDKVVPPGANVAIRYRTGSTNPQIPVFATKNFTLAERILPGRSRALQSAASWKGDCTALASW